MSENEFNTLFENVSNEVSNTALTPQIVEKLKQEIEENHSHLSDNEKELLLISRYQSVHNQTLIRELLKEIVVSEA